MQLYHQTSADVPLIVFALVGYYQYQSSLVLFSLCRLILPIVLYHFTYNSPLRFKMSNYQTLAGTDRPDIEIEALIAVAHVAIAEAHEPGDAWKAGMLGI